MVAASMLILDGALVLRFIEPIVEKSDIRLTFSDRSFRQALFVLRILNGFGYELYEMCFCYGVINYAEFFKFHWFPLFLCFLISKI